jgi:hypothetical protein
MEKGTSVMDFPTRTQQDACRIYQAVLELVNLSGLWSSDSLFMAAEMIRNGIVIPGDPKDPEYEVALDIIGFLIGAGKDTHKYELTRKKERLNETIR